VATANSTGAVMAKASRAAAKQVGMASHHAVGLLLTVTSMHSVVTDVCMGELSFWGGENRGWGEESRSTVGMHEGCACRCLHESAVGAHMHSACCCLHGCLCLCACCAAAVCLVKSFLQRWWKACPATHYACSKCIYQHVLMCALLFCVLGAK
jgi:hypothetical protein